LHSRGDFANKGETTMRSTSSLRESRVEGAPISLCGLSLSILWLTAPRQRRQCKRASQPRINGALGSSYDSCPVKPITLCIELSIKDHESSHVNKR
jgi:hypothetical protein